MPEKPPKRACRCTHKRPAPQPLDKLGEPYLIGVNPKPRALKSLSNFCLRKSPGPGRSADADLLVKPAGHSNMQPQAPRGTKKAGWEAAGFTDIERELLVVE